MRAFDEVQHEPQKSIECLVECDKLFGTWFVIVGSGNVKYVNTYKVGFFVTLLIKTRTKIGIVCRYKVFTRFCYNNYKTD